MESDDLDALGGRMAAGQQPSGGPDDTQTIRFRRCGVCGLPVFFREGEEPQLICAKCDVEVTTAIVDLLLKGHRIPQSWKEADAPASGTLAARSRRTVWGDQLAERRRTPDVTPTPTTQSGLVVVQ